ncbi:MAG: hypothetical protein E7619_01980 [Ruminococcaceae bacterium]|nr:hypothetical protein [Oscillospiraceae bacterium]
MSERYFEMKAEEVAEFFDTSDSSGLTAKEARKRLRYFGQNKIYDIRNREGSNSVLSLLLSPAGLMFYASAAACVALHISGAAVSAAIWTVAMIILAIIKMRSGSVLSAVYACGIPRARVVRDGKPKLIDSRSLVPGDLVLLSEGDIVCADCRIVYTEGIKLREHNGADEYRTVDKNANPCPEALIPSEMVNMAFASSTVTNGAARAIVTATGRETLVLTDNGGELLSIRGTRTCRTVDRAKKTEKILCLISACALFLMCIILLVAAPREPIEYFFVSAASAVFWMCGACGIICEYAVANTVTELSASSECRSLIKNVASLDMLADADVLICGETFVQPYLGILARETAKYGIRAYIAAMPDTAGSIAEACHGFLVASPLDAPDVKGSAPVVVVCRSPADRARLAAALTSAGHVTAAVASKAGHIGMFNLSSVSLCCAALELSAKKITDISLEDIDRSAGNEAMMKNSDVLCPPALHSVLANVGGARAFVRNVSAVTVYACTVCAAMLLTMFITLFGNMGALPAAGAVVTAFPIAPLSMLILAAFVGMSHKRPDERETVTRTVFGVFSAVLWFGALVAVRVLASELGVDMSNAFRGYCSCSLMFFAAVSALFLPGGGIGAKNRLAASLPIVLSVALAVAALLIPGMRVVLFPYSNLYIILLAAVPALFASGLSALNRAVYLKFKSKRG